jgi:hypothetical protein
MIFKFESIKSAKWNLICFEVWHNLILWPAITGSFWQKFQHIDPTTGLVIDLLPRL